MQQIFLDIQTTGVNAKKDRIVEIAIIDEAGEILLNTLVNPLQPIPDHARRIHGITNEDVESAPAYGEIAPYIERICKDKHLIAYNATMNTCFLPTIEPLKVSCAMLRYADRYNYRVGERLAAAAKKAKFDWEGETRYRALTSAMACRKVWKFLDESEPEDMIPYMPQHQVPIDIQTSVI